MTNTVKSKERKLHLIRRQNPSFSYSVFVRLIAILLSFIVITIVFSSIGKFTIGETLQYINKGAFGDKYNTSETFINMMYILVLAIGLAPAYKMKYWNTGALGQALIGNLCSALIIYKLGPVISSNFLLLLIAFICAIIGGAIWGVIPGIFRAKFGANETLFTLMTNYVAIKLCDIIIEVLKGNSQQLKMSEYGKFDAIGASENAVVYIIVAILFVVMFVYLKYTKHGYELSVVGESVNTAKYAGINVELVTIRTAAISGAICAICGFMYTGINKILSTGSDGGYGFTSIIVTWSSHFSLVAMAIIAFLIAFIKKGSDGVKNKASDVMNDYASYISIGLFLFLLIGCEFFLNYRFVKNSEFAKKQMEKREILKEKNPMLYSFLTSLSNFCAVVFVTIDDFLNKIKAQIITFFKKLISLFLNLFKKTAKEEK